MRQDGNLLLAPLVELDYAPWRGHQGGHMKTIILAGGIGIKPLHTSLRKLTFRVCDFKQRVDEVASLASKPQNAPQTVK